MAVDAELFGDALPTYLTRFVGRAAECRALAAVLDRTTLVTVCGVGGAGKTRLALEVAKRVRTAAAKADDPVQVYWVPLVGVTSPAEVGSALAAGVGLTGPIGELHVGPIVSMFGAGRVLLVLDNCEQVAIACGTILGRLIAGCPRLTVMTTSRIPLGRPEEVVYAIPPMGSEASGADPHPTDAIELFVDRASTLAPSYSVTDLNAGTLGDICRLLNGQPLAIELAASWIRVLSPRDLLTHLTDARSALESGSGVVEERHRSLRAVLDSTWQWLGPSERSVLGALGVFAGGFTREAAEAVAGADLASLARLTELTLIQRLPAASGRSRYQVHELIRVYALSRLDCPEVVRERHLTYFLDLAEGLPSRGSTPPEPVSVEPIRADVANIDAATAWALDRGDAERAQRLAVGLDQFWISCSLSSEHRLGRLLAALDLPGSLETLPAILARARALYAVGTRLFAADPTHCQIVNGEALTLFERAGDLAGVAACLRQEGNALFSQGDLAGCRRYCLASLVKCFECGDLIGAAWCRETIANADLASGDWAEAQHQLDEAVRMFTELGSTLGTCQCELERGLSYQLGGQWVEAVDACVRALDLERAHRITAAWAEIIEVIARLFAEQRRWTTAARLYGVVAGWHSDHDAVSWFPFAGRFSRVAQVRRHLDGGAWSEPYEDGRRLSYDEATRLAYDCLAELRDELEVAFSGLSARELEVLRLVADGLGDADIAEHLVVSPRTVHAHLRSVYRKLDVTSRTAAIRAAGLAVLPGRNVP